jgi:membrane-associated phospholipid phosphatase
MRPLDVATLVYLAAGLTVLAISRPSAWLLLSLAHLASMGGILWRRPANPLTPHWFRDWYALLLIPFFYAEIPILNAGFLSAARDESIRSPEALWFPFEPVRTFAAAAPWWPLSETLHFAYLCYYPIIYVPLLVLFLKGKREAFQETAFTVGLTYYCSFLIFVFWPVLGPWDLLPVARTVPDGPLRRLAVAILIAGSSRGTAFPSSHLAVAVTQTLCVGRHLPRLAPLLGLLSAGIAIGAVYASFHYAVDMLAGAAVGVVVTIVARQLSRTPRRWFRLRCSAREHL